MLTAGATGRHQELELWFFRGYLVIVVLSNLPIINILFRSEQVLDYFAGTLADEYRS